MILMFRSWMMHQNVLDTAERRGPSTAQPTAAIERPRWDSSNGRNPMPQAKYVPDSTPTRWRERCHRAVAAQWPAAHPDRLDALLDRFYRVVVDKDDATVIHRHGPPPGASLGRVAAKQWGHSLEFLGA